MLKILKTPEGKKFLIAVACVFIVAVCVVSKAAFRAWKTSTICRWIRDTSLFIIRGAWVAIYSFMFTIVGRCLSGFTFSALKMIQNN